MGTPSEPVPLSNYVEFPPDEMRERASAFLNEARRRRTVRDFSDRPIPRDIEILGRPENERPFLILVVGYPAPAATVPQLPRKALEEIVTFIE